MANTVFIKTTRTGGGATALDGADINILNDGDRAFMIYEVSAGVFVWEQYIFDADSVVAENTTTHPFSIRPDNFATAGVWIEAVLTGTVIKDGTLYMLNSGVAHGMTSLAPTSAFAKVSTNGATGGGVSIYGLTDEDNAPVEILGISGAADPGAAVPMIHLRAGKKNGTTWQAIAADDLAFEIENYTTSLVQVLGNGNAWFVADVSALTFTDRTPFYEGDAVAEILLIKGKDGEIDHATLPEFARKTVVMRTAETQETEERRDLGAMISMLTVAIQQLEARIKALEAK